MIEFLEQPCTKIKKKDCNRALKMAKIYQTSTIYQYSPAKKIQYKIYFTTGSDVCMVRTRDKMNMKDYPT